VVGDDQPDAGDGQAGRPGMAERLVVCAGQRQIRRVKSLWRSNEERHIESGGNARCRRERKYGEA